MDALFIAIPVFVAALFALSAPRMIRDHRVNRLLETASQPPPGGRVRELLRALETGDVEPLRGALRAALEAGDFDRRGYLVAACGRGAHVEPFAAWVAREPGCAAARLMHAQALAQRGYEVRGTGRAESVSARDAATFATLTERARLDYLEAASLEPADPAPWAGLLMTGTSLGMSLGDAWDLYAEATRRHPSNWDAAYAMLRATCRKWGGSHEVMFEFARNAADGAPPGDARHTLVAIAHFERWMYFSWFEDDPGGGARHCADPRVQAEVEAALMDAFGPPPISPVAGALARLEVAPWYACHGAAARAKELSFEGLSTLHLAC